MKQSTGNVWLDTRLAEQRERGHSVTAAADALCDRMQALFRKVLAATTDEAHWLTEQVVQEVRDAGWQPLDVSGPPEPDLPKPADPCPRCWGGPGQLKPCSCPE